MAFVSYEQLKKAYPTGRMKENVRRIKDYDVFHCLLAGNAERAAAVKKRASDLPGDFLKWLDVCDGGMLFDTAMLSTKSHDDELDLPFATYGNYHNAELRKEKGIRSDWFVFAVAVHSDVFFFDMGKKDGKVYQWDIEEHKIYAAWPTFEDWLTDEINEAVALIADEKLEPLDIKLEADGNG
jgi:hypothetical protein